HGDSSDFPGYSLSIPWVPPGLPLAGALPSRSYGRQTRLPSLGRDTSDGGCIDPLGAPCLRRALRDGRWTATAPLPRSRGASLVRSVGAVLVARGAARVRRPDPARLWTGRS